MLIYFVGLTQWTWNSLLLIIRACLFYLWILIIREAINCGFFKDVFLKDVKLVRCSLRIVVQGCLDCNTAFKTCPLFVLASAFRTTIHSLKLKQGGP